MHIQEDTYTYNQIVCNGAKNFTVQYVANRRNECEYIYYPCFNIITCDSNKTRSDC